MTSTRRLWNIAQVQSSNLIENGHINQAFNKALTNTVLGYFDKFTSGSGDIYNTTSTSGHKYDGNGRLLDPKDTTGNKNSRENKRRRKKTALSSTRLTSRSSESQLLRNKYNVDPKTGLTTNDHFFEHQRINGFCQQTMLTPEISWLHELLGSEVQRYLSSIHHMAASDILSRLCSDPTVKLDMWATIQIGNLAYHADHVHENVYVSGVYYSSVPEGSAPLVFHRPLKEETKDKCFDFETQDEDDKFVIHPEEGQVVIFPPWLLHGVPPATEMGPANFPRVSFAFNLSGFTIGDPWEVTKL